MNKHMKENGFARFWSGITSGLKSVLKLGRRFKEANPRWSVMLFWILSLVAVITVSLLVRSHAVQAFYINSTSMEPTLMENDRIFVNKLSYKTHGINRGDIVIIKRSALPDGATGSLYMEDLIKRVVALEGETLRIENCVVYINDQRLVEPYMTPLDTNSVDYRRRCTLGPVFELEIPENHIFVLGDNRLNSVDSRSFGPISENAVAGRAFIKIWPFWDFTAL